MKQRGIALIELILVLVVIGILVGLFITARNPMTQASINRNLEREFDITQIAQSVHQYKIHNKDKYPKTNDGKAIASCDKKEEDSEKDIKELTKASSLTEALVADYLTKIPKDPQTENEYLLCITEEEKIKVVAPDSELGKEIELIR
jgi:type II secretory pathway pseudopilin PulG